MDNTFLFTFTGGGPDRSGDLGGVLHHPRVRGPRRVRPHPQDHPGPQEAGVQGQEAGEVYECDCQGGEAGQTLLLQACLQRSVYNVLCKVLKAPLIRWTAWRQLH